MKKIIISGIAVWLFIGCNPPKTVIVELPECTIVDTINVVMDSVVVTEIIEQTGFLFQNECIP